jgi:serine/threonine protein kinase
MLMLLDYGACGDLRTYLNARPRLTEPELKFLAMNVILALKAVHSQRVLHRDVKP